MKQELKVKRLHPDAKLPTKAHFGDLGYDMYALEDTVVPAGIVTKVRTGIAIEFPQYIGGIVKDRSSVATKQNLQVVAGVIDSQFCGEIIIAFYNSAPIEYVIEYEHIREADDYEVNFKKVVADISLNDGAPYHIKAGDKIAQLVLQEVITFPITEVDELGTTERGDAGFGSTGAR
jgi:dUTP pyrophosphatase